MDLFSGENTRLLNLSRDPKFWATSSMRLFRGRMVTAGVPAISAYRVGVGYCTGSLALGGFTTSSPSVGRRWTVDGAYALGASYEVIDEIRRRSSRFVSAIGQMRCRNGDPRLMMGRSVRLRWPMSIFSFTLDGVGVCFSSQLEAYRRWDHFPSQRQS